MRDAFVDSHSLLWRDNQGTSPVTFIERVISPQTDHQRKSAVTDFDGGGALAGLRA